MKKMFVGFLIALLGVVSLNAQVLRPFDEGERVVFLGNSITDGGHYHSYIWLYYMTRFPDKKFTILNAGVGGDAVANMNRRLDGDVFSKNPTSLFITFGMNDSGYFEYNGDNPKEFGQQKYDECHENYKLMEKRLEGLNNVNIVMMGSSPYDETAKIENEAFRTKNETMKRIVEFQKKSAQAHNWEFIDFNESMTALNTKFQKKDPAFTICGDDRIHPDNDGHMVMAYLFLKAQGFDNKEVAKINVDAKRKQLVSSTNCDITDMKQIGSELSFNYLAKALPYPLDTIARGWGSKKSQSGVTNIVPFMDEMNTEELKVSGLAKGKYSVKIDNEEVGVWSESDLTKGINLASISKTPQYQQALKVMHMNEERWEIEKRFREYAWVQYNFFQKNGLLFADNRKAIEVMDREVPNDGWLRAKRDIYTKLMHPEVREMWQLQIDLLVNKIYELNKPVARTISIKKVN